MSKTETTNRLVEALTQLVSSTNGTPTTETSDDDVVGQLVTTAGLKFAKGRVKANKRVIEAQARVLNTGTPEVVPTGGQRVTHVVIWRVDADTPYVAVQNCYQPK